MKNFLSKYLFLISFATLTCQGNLIAQDTQIQASAPSSVVIGEAFNYTISGDFSGDVVLPQVKGLKLVGGPSTFVSQQSSMINGRIESVKTVTYTYTFLAKEAGDLVFPPATVTSGRKVFKTNEVTIKVVNSRQDTQSGEKGSSSEVSSSTESVFIRQIGTKSSIYLGEQFVLSTKIFTQEALNISSFKAPGFDGFWRQELEGDNTAIQEKVNGEVYLSQVFKRDLLTAQKTGIISIEPADIECLVKKKVSQGRQNGFNDPFFNDSFFDRYENVPQGFKTNAVSITVKPLPSGAPAGFDGAVGSFNMKANVDKEKLKVNDAITVKVHISGKGNLDLLKPVKIDFPPDLEVFDPKTTQNLKHSDNGTNGSLDYEYILIPRHAGNFRISPIVFSWFDPDEGKYKTDKSAEFNFVVEKADGNDEAYITSPLASGNVRQTSKEVVSLAGDIKFIRITSPELTKIGKTVFDSGLFYASFLLPILFIISLVIFRKERIRRNADINAVRNRKARKLAEKRLKNASVYLTTNDNGFYDEILKAIWGYLSDKLGVNVSDLSREKISAKLQSKEIDSSIQISLWELLDDCEMARYASGLGESDKQKIYEKAMALISVLQEKIS